MYKARYYLHSHFLEAKLNNNPSFIWRSILVVLDLVKAGARLLVGTGKSINIWEESWLPDEVNPVVESTPVWGSNQQLWPH